MTIRLQRRICHGKGVDSISASDEPAIFSLYMLARRDWSRLMITVRQIGYCESVYLLRLSRVQHIGVKSDTSTCGPGRNADTKGDEAGMMDRMQDKPILALK
jgi:hypothetical protein